MPTQLPSVEILGVEVTSASSSAAVDEIERLADGEPPLLVVYVNAHTLNLASTDDSYLELIRSAGVVLNDGIGVALAARLHGHRFPENLNGSDFNPRILELAARRRWRVFLLGASAGVAETAARRLVERWPDLEIVGTRDGFFSRSQDAEVAASIKALSADLVMVAMGNPLQERWLAENLHATGARVGVGVGAFFDFTAGTAKRAPGWMNRAGIEWVWRLVQEPRRLWKRYVVGNPVFLVRVLRDRFRSLRRSGV